MDFLSPQNVLSMTITALLILLGIAVFISVSALLGYAFVLYLRHKDREKQSLHSTVLQVALPRDNEIKIDAAEQMFGSLASIRKGGWFLWAKSQPHISFEIVGMPSDIRFYIHVPNKLRDLVEKQLNGAYPDAEITVVEEKDGSPKNSVIGNEYNIFSENGKVAFASLKLKSEDYKPLKVYKDLAVDPLSSITSVLAKMTEGEGAVIQMVISPASGEWKKHGKSYISKTKKAEANPETAKYSVDAKELEGIESKTSKPGFETIIRIVVSSSSEEAAKRI
jgi:hypothetical protein